MRTFDKAYRLATRHPVYLIAAPIFLGLGVQALTKRGAEWLDVYVPAARALLRGGDIYAEGTSYLYPPFAALIAIPFAPLPNLLIRLGWYVINILAIVLLARSAWSISGGSRLEFTNVTDRREWFVLLIGTLCSVAYGLNTLAHQQTDLVIGALVLGGCCTLLRGRPVAAAFLIGLGAAFKGPPLLFAAYFIFRRNWLVAGLIVVVAVGVNLLPDLVSPPDTGIWLGRWLTRFVLPTAHFDSTLGNWGSALIYNQSLAGTVQRLANTALVARPSGLDVVAQHASIDNGTLKAIVYGTMLCMVALSAWATRNGGRKAWENSPQPQLPRIIAMEFAIVFILMLLMSPMSGLAHFVVLALPSLCLARLAVLGHRRIAIAAISVAAAGAFALNKDLVGGVAYDAILWSGGATVSAIALWLGCFAALANGDCQFEDFGSRAFIL